MKTKLYFLLFVILISSCTQVQQKETIEPNKEYELTKDQTIVLGNLEITLTQIIYSPCPEDARCIWSGLAADFLVKQQEKKETFKLEIGQEKEIFNIKIKLIDVKKDTVRIIINN